MRKSVVSADDRASHASQAERLGMGARIHGLADRTVSTLGALFLSEVMGVAPCVLCWYQRIFMFPLVFVLATGLFPLDCSCWA